MTVAEVKRSFASVCLSVCLSDRSITQTQMMPMYSNSASQMTLDYPTSGNFGLKVNGQWSRSRGHWVNKCTFHILKAIERLA